MFDLLSKKSRNGDPGSGTDGGQFSASLPPGMRIYAIGDIHGRADLLEALLAQIGQDAAAAAELSHTLIFLGDYVDRGPQSRLVLEILSGPPPAGFGLVPLRGNHERSMLEFLDGTSDSLLWLAYGGDATLASYGLPAINESADPHLVEQIRLAFREAVPPSHLNFLRRMRNSLSVGDYFFAHAGVRPGTPLDQQVEDDLLWIRNDFLNSRTDHGKVVVHGHTKTRSPVNLVNRIGIDTGAYASNRLTALVLEGTQRRFLDTQTG